MKINSIEIIKTLHSKGYQALWAGGCVRDMLLSKHPKDFDIVTDAPPTEVENDIR
jgi:poly(A) polymerase